MQNRKLVRTVVALAAGAGIGSFLGNYRNELERNAGATANSADAEACELETKQPRRGVLALHMAQLDGGKYITRFELK